MYVIFAMVKFPYSNHNLIRLIINTIKSYYRSNAKAMNRYVQCREIKSREIQMRLYSNEICHLAL